VSDRILVVEDDPNIRKILTLQLLRAGYQATPAEDGVVALEILEHETFDLILLDVMMPRQDGFTTCRKLRANRLHQQTPIIFLTAKTGPQDRLEGLSGGGNDYISKPYDTKELLLRVRNLITWSRAQRHSNPLTGLPGNPSIEAETQQRMTEGRAFAFLYCDLDNFKAFNDYYSYLAGDGVIKLLARILQESVAQVGAPDDFVGHVGGDDFVVITNPENALLVARTVVARFDTEVLEHYRPDDRDRGYVAIENRRGVVEEFPLVSLTIALVESERYHIHHMGMLNDIVAELKHFGKQRPGSQIVTERRRAAAEEDRTGSEG